MTPGEVTFFIRGVPIPKGRPRVTKSGHAYTPATTRAWEEHVAWQGQRICGSRSDFPLKGSCKVELTFSGARKNADSDNLAKAVLDGLNGIAFDDDKQVVDLRVVRSSDSDDVGVLVQVKELL